MAKHLKLVFKLTRILWLPINMPLKKNIQIFDITPLFTNHSCFKVSTRNHIVVRRLSKHRRLNINSTITYTTITKQR